MSASGLTHVLGYSTLELVCQFVGPLGSDGAGEFLDGVVGDGEAASITNRA